MSSRLAVDSSGRRVAVQTVPSGITRAGVRWVVRGNTLADTDGDGHDRVHWLGEASGRPNTVTTRRRSVRDWLPADEAARRR